MTRQPSIKARVAQAVRDAIKRGASRPYHRPANALRQMAHGDPRRSKWMPAGPQRNCGHRGISPKSFARALDAATS